MTGYEATLRRPLAEQEFVYAVQGGVEVLELRLEGFWRQASIGAGQRFIQSADAGAAVDAGEDGAGQAGERKIDGRAAEVAAEAGAGFQAACDGGAIEVAEYRDDVRGVGFRDRVGGVLGA